MEKRLHVAVIGSVNVDICGQPEAHLRPRDSNPGTVRTALGGVGSNIARNLRLLGVDVSLVTAIGADHYGRMAETELLREGLDLSLALHAPDENTSTYLYITDAQGDMQLAIADMRIQERLSPEFLAPLLPRLNRMDGVVIDANMRADTLAFAAERITVPLFADGVSAAKVTKLKPVLPRLHALKLNRLEAAQLTGQQAPAQMIKALHDMGAAQGCITFGAEGAAYFQEENTLIAPPPPPRRVVNTTGAGDAFTAAMIWALLSGKSGADTLQIAQAAAAIALEGAEAVNLELSANNVLSYNT